MIKIYHDILLSECIALGAKAIKEYKTQVVRTDVGKEQRGIEWLTHLRTFDIGTGIKRWENLDEMVNIFHACEGSYAGFLMRDFTDWRSGVGNVDYQPMVQDPVDPLEWYFFKSANVIDLDDSPLIRTDAYHCRFVVSSTVIIKDQGSIVYNYDLDKINGKVFFDTEPTAPEASFEYNIAVRFLNDSIDELYNWAGAGSIQCRLEQVYRFELEDNIHYITSVPYTINERNSLDLSANISSIKGVLSPQDSISSSASIAEMAFRDVTFNKENENSYAIPNIEIVSGTMDSVIIETEVDPESYAIFNMDIVSGDIKVTVIIHDLQINTDDIDKYYIPSMTIISGDLY